MSESAVPPAGRRTAAFGFIFVSAVACAVSIGIMVPVLPNLLKQFNGGDTANAADWGVTFNVCGGLMSFFIGPMLGLLSDRFGRRPVLLLSITGLGLDFLFMAFAPSLGWLFVGRLISGATSGVFSTANAYVADVTPPERRARAFGWMGAAFTVGFLLGPAVGGFLGDINLRLPFLVAAALTLVNVLYGFFVVPESLPESRRATSFHWRRANPLGSLRLLRSHH
ncbi:MAG: MFS transporter, partial [Alphaproteobacteria bacterium]|nr:MFS transporter [Alphaproteobacteria bacterium]